ncbi:DUF305 domain-containing protein [Nocardioides aurantiacus]|uniref:Uncharacterized protein (DUF305 family) n=1 Tax=Nocardioides aurantiacus TaxID=86796 RepID=A0A3N2CWB9_9ACTN|nr:DUF305 domain-containing protein [Nocardioides aurantiacus]ROR91830.1 uncharacterized protein (DUF305 family) [Nocardioides aurantiacus]
MASVIAAIFFVRERPPASDSPEAGFARDMQVHHAQAVEMSLIVRDKSDDPEVRALAYDIATSQQQQIGQMAAWLQLWDLPASSEQPQMSWMRGAEGDGQPMQMPTDGRMPGLASPEQLDQLRQAKPGQGEALFLELMIEHHKAGAAMARAAYVRTDEPAVRSLSSAIVTSQMAEVRAMEGLLDSRRPATVDQER